MKPGSNFRLFLEGIYVQTKWLYIIGIAAAVIASFYYVIQLNISMAVLPMMVIFTLTNAMRASSFKKQGMEREAKWMRILSMFFAVAFVVLFIINVVL